MVTRPDHDYYSLIARAVDALHINVRDTRLMHYEQARRAQLSSFDPAIPEADFRRERTALDKAIRAIETKAAATDDKQAQSDRKIVSDYAGFMAESARRLDCFYDVSVLPHPRRIRKRWPSSKALPRRTALPASTNTTPSSAISVW
jgi:hypothetical protein